MTATLGTRIKDQRTAQGLSQDGLAARVGATGRAVRWWETGQKHPADDLMATLADALEVSVGWLETGADTVPLDAAALSIPFHPLANLFPLIEGADFEALVADMKANGFRSGEEIIIYEGMILDGRNRYRAAIAAWIIPQAYSVAGKTVFRHQFREFGSEAGEWDTKTDTTADPLAFVLSKNLHRRHLTASQRALLAARLADLPAGRRESNVPDGTITSEAAAEAVGVSVRSVRRARKVIETATPEMADAVAAGQVTVASAADMADLPPETQRKIIKAANPAVLNKVVAEARAEKTAAKKVRRAEREVGLAKKIVAMPGHKFGVIYADPEWKFEVRSENGLDRAADNHYPTSDLAAIKSRLETAFDHDLRSPDCVLFLWATAPMMPQALDVMTAWGFDYVSQFVWIKPRAGTGFWNRNRHEILLIGKCGNVLCPAAGTQWDSVFNATTGRHSQKPAKAAEMIEAYYPNLPKIELNAREARSGWTSIIHDPDAGQMVVGPDGQKQEARSAPRALPVASPRTGSGATGNVKNLARSTPRASPLVSPRTGSGATGNAKNPERSE